MQGIRHSPAMTQRLLFVRWKWPCPPTPVGSTCEKTKQPLDQRWVDRHGQQFVDHEVWLHSVESTTEVNEEDSRMYFAGQGIYIGDGEGSVLRPRCSCSVSRQTVVGLACRPFLPSAAS